MSLVFNEDQLMLQESARSFCREQAPVAVLRKMLASGKIDPAAETVIVNSGDGLKTLDAVADVVGPTAFVTPALESAIAAIDEISRRQQ
jgi:threonine synthase